MTSKTPVYKFEVYVVDFEQIGIEDIQYMLENCEDSISVAAVHTDTTEVDWHVDIDINQTDQREEAFQKLFD